MLEGLIMKKHTSKKRSKNLGICLRFSLLEKKKTATEVGNRLHTIFSQRSVFLDQSFVYISNLPS